LAVGSPQVPAPGAVGAKPVRKAASKAQQPTSPRSSASVPADLMAWTRNIHTDHGQH
jgi:hypothetical protein